MPSCGLNYQRARHIPFTVRGKTHPQSKCTPCSHTFTHCNLKMHWSTNKPSRRMWILLGWHCNTAHGKLQDMVKLACNPTVPLSKRPFYMNSYCAFFFPLARRITWGKLELFFERRGFSQAVISLYLVDWPASIRFSPRDFHLRPNNKDDQPFTTPLPKFEPKHFFVSRIFAG